jgi:hypothetical protein
MLVVSTEAAELGTQRDERQPQVKVQGAILDIGAYVIVIETPTTTYRVDRRSVPMKAHIGDKVTLWVTSNHVVIEHHHQATGERHRFVMGTLLDTDSKSQIRLWTPEGNKVYSLAPHEAKVRVFQRGRW